MAILFFGVRKPEEIPMCDYSLHAVASRAAKAGETLVTTGFYGTSTRGFAAKDQPSIAVCLLPGTELAFDHEVRYSRARLYTRCANWCVRSAGSCVARFCKIEPCAPDQHRDALSFPDGSTVLVNELSEGQHARVIQLPVVELELNVCTHPQKSSGSLNEAELTV
jgi:hypothetical protein